MSVILEKKRHPSLQKTKMHLAKPKWQHKDDNSDFLLNKSDLFAPTFDENLLPQSSTISKILMRSWNGYVMNPQDMHDKKAMTILL